MAGTQLGAWKTAAKRIGLTLEDYREKLDAGLKWCTGCKQWKPKAQFGKNRACRDGLATSCLDCITQRFTVKAVGTRERRAKRKVGLYWCKDCHSWQPRDLMRFASHGHSSGLCHEHHKEAQRDNYATNPERRRKAYLSAKKRKEKTRSLPARERRRLIDIFGGRCAYCQERPIEAWDHVVPLAAGGQDQIGNIVPACQSCNSSKLDRDLLEWVEAKGIVLSDAILSVIGVPEETVDYTPYRNRMVILRGADNKQAAFTNEEVREIRELYKDGDSTYAQLAKRWNVHQATIRRAVTGKTYRQAEGPISHRNLNNAAFTNQEAQQIRREHALGEHSFAEIANKHSVHKATIERIIRGKTYKDG